VFDNYFWAITALATVLSGVAFVVLLRRRVKGDLPMVIVVGLLFALSVVALVRGENGENLSFLVLLFGFAIMALPAPAILLADVYRIRGQHGVARFWALVALVLFPTALRRQYYRICTRLHSGDRGRTVPAPSEPLAAIERLQRPSGLIALSASLTVEQCKQGYFPDPSEQPVSFFHDTVRYAVAVYWLCRVGEIGLALKLGSRMEDAADDPGWGSIADVEEVDALLNRARISLMAATGRRVVVKDALSLRSSQRVLFTPQDRKRLLALADLPAEENLGWAALLEMVEDRLRVQVRLPTRYSDLASPSVGPLLLVTALAGVFVWTVSTGSSLDGRHLARLGALLPHLLSEGEIWRLFSCAFLHAGIIHLALNIFMVLMFGNIVERLGGPVALVWTYGTAAIGGSLAASLFGKPGVLVGASGAAFGLMGAALVVVARSRQNLPKRFVSNHLVLIVGLLLWNLVLGATIPFISLSAHVGGFVVGFAVAAILEGAQLVGLDLRRPWAAWLTGVIFGIIATLTLAGAIESWRKYEMVSTRPVTYHKDPTLVRQQVVHFLPLSFADWSPDDRYIVTSGSSDSGLGIWETETGRLVRVIHPHSRVSVVAWLPGDGGIVGLDPWFGRLGNWDAETGQQRWTRRLDRGLFTLAVSPDGSLVAVAGGQDTAEVVSTVDGSRVYMLNERFSPKVWQFIEYVWGTSLFDRKDEERLMNVAFSLDGKRVFGANSIHGLQIFDAADGRLVDTVARKWESLECFRVNAAGSLVTVEGLTVDSKRVTLWNPDGSSEQHTLEVGDKAYLPSYIGPDGSVLLCLSDAQGGAVLTVLDAALTSRRVVADVNPGMVALSRCGTRLLVQENKALSIRNLWDESTLTLAEDHASPVVSVGFTSTDPPDLITGDGGSVQIWRSGTVTKDQPFAPEVLSCEPTDQSFSLGSDTLLCPVSDSVVRIDVSGKSIAENVGKLWWVTVSGDGRRMAGVREATDDGQEVVFGNVGGHLGRLPIGIEVFRDKWYSPISLDRAGRRLVVSGYVQSQEHQGGTGIEVWDLDGPSLVASLDLYNRRNLSGAGVLLHPSGTFAAIPYRHNIRLWDVKSETDVANEIDAQGEFFCTALAFSPDGCRMAAARGGVVLVWALPPALSGRDCTPFPNDGATDILTGLSQVMFETTSAHVFSLAFNGDGSLIAAGGHDGTTTVIDLRAGQLKTVVGTFRYRPSDAEWSWFEQGWFRFEPGLAEAPLFGRGNPDNALAWRVGNRIVSVKDLDGWQWQEAPPDGER